MGYCNWQCENLHPHHDQRKCGLARSNAVEFAARHPLNHYFVLSRFKRAKASCRTSIIFMRHTGRAKATEGREDGSAETKGNGRGYTATAGCRNTRGDVFAG